MHMAARVDHAISAALVLPEPSEPPVAGAALADELGISYPYLMTIIDPLKKAGLARVRRGPQGGLSLARGSADITLADVIWAVDAPLDLADGSRALARPGPAAPRSAADIVGHRPRRGVRRVLTDTARRRPSTQLIRKPERMRTGCVATGGLPSGSRPDRIDA